MCDKKAFRPVKVYKEPADIVIEACTEGMKLEYQSTGKIDFDIIDEMARLVELTLIKHDVEFNEILYEWKRNREHEPYYFSDDFQTGAFR